MQVMQYFLTGLLLAIIFLDNARALPAEPVSSKFDYEMKTLEAMLRIENRTEKMMEEFRSVRDSLTKEFDEIKNLKTEVERQQTALESNFTALKSEAERQKVAMQTAMESKFTALKSEVEVPDEAIAFSVTNLTGTFVSGVPTFSDVITNIGNGYGVDTGIFTCPFRGVYMFVFTVASHGQYNVWCWIRHDGYNKVLGRSYSDNSYTTASASVSLLLQKGGSVTLGSCGGCNNVDTTSSFSGALLQKTYREN